MPHDRAFQCPIEWYSTPFPTLTDSINSKPFSDHSIATGSIMDDGILNLR